jgi:hypothetical protein
MLRIGVELTANGRISHGHRALNQSNKKQVKNGK